MTKDNQTGVEHTKTISARIKVSVLPFHVLLDTGAPGELGQYALFTNIISCMKTKERIKNVRGVFFCARVNEINILMTVNSLNRLIIGLGESRQHTNMFCFVFLLFSLNHI